MAVLATAFSLLEGLGDSEVEWALLLSAFVCVVLGDQALGQDSTYH